MGKGAVAFLPRLWISNLSAGDAGEKAWETLEEPAKSILSPLPTAEKQKGEPGQSHGALHPSAALINDVISLIRQGGPEICCCSCIWPEAFPGQVAPDWAADKPGGKAMAKLTRKNRWVWPCFFVHQRAQCSTIRLQKTPGKNPTCITFEHQVREQLEGSGRKSAVKGTHLHPYWNINSLTKTTHLDFSVAMIKPLQDPFSLGESTVFIHKWWFMWQIVHREQPVQAKGPVKT